jgi:apolipoprotein N-acyltransferase
MTLDEPPRPPATEWLSLKATLALGLVAIAGFEAAYEFESAALAIIGYLACLFWLAWVRTPRVAFYTGFVIGGTIAGLQLNFFFGIFGPAAIGLWAILGLWTAFYLLLSRVVVARWPQWGCAWLPLIWLAVEYFRSELYYLRFAWLTPAWALAYRPWTLAVAFGVYGFSFLILTLFVVLRRASISRVTAAVVVLIVLLATQWIRTNPTGTGPLLVGIQLESPDESTVLAALDRAVAEHRKADIFVLSEYCFHGRIPPEIYTWCLRHEKYLVAGGKEPLDPSPQYFNTVFVINPKGKLEFQQAKSVPIQFFNDGLPAREQKLWASPWGKIGLAICYDLSYSRIIDRLVEAGAEGLIIPTMDAEDWGAHQHRLHARIAPARAREYGLPIFRLASSGISQLVDRNGNVLASAPFPGQGELLVGRLELGTPGKLPLDRYLALPAVIAIGTLLAYLAACNLQDRYRTAMTSKPRAALADKSHMC